MKRRDAIKSLGLAPLLPLDWCGTKSAKEDNTNQQRHERHSRFSLFQFIMIRPCKND